MISVLVAVHDIERHVGLCLESIIQQQYQALEIIVVDDGSTDRSGEICDLYARKDRRVRIIHKPNGGLVSARKAALQAAHGHYIGYVDGDDWVAPGFYAELVQSAKDCDADAVVAGFSRDLFETSQKLDNAVPLGVYDGEKRECLFGNLISTGPFFRHGVTTYLWNKLFKREIVENAQMSVDERISIGEDGATTYPALLNCQRICIIPNHDYHYRQREDSMLKKAAPFGEEKAQLQALHNHLSMAMRDTPSEYELVRQEKEYLLSACIIRSGGIAQTPDGVVHLPFARAFRGARVAICGAGTFGQQLERRLKEWQYCEIAAWVDEDFWEYRRCCLDVDPVDRLKDMDFDYVLLGRIDRIGAQSLRAQLEKMGIPGAMILGVDVEPKDVSAALGYYLTT
ncbi:MAG: glycosyltransferase [Kiritimatiellae bacterium]|nr:glycosyltransferase [Kiritimatiellia bacterium]